MNKVLNGMISIVTNNVMLPVPNQLINISQHASWSKTVLEEKLVSLNPKSIDTQITFIKPNTLTYIQTDLPIEIKINANTNTSLIVNSIMLLSIPVTVLFLTNNNETMVNISVYVI